MWFQRPPGTPQLHSDAFLHTWRVYFTESAPDVMSRGTNQLEEV